MYLNKKHIFLLTIPGIENIINTLTLQQHPLLFVLFSVLETKTEILGPGFTSYKLSDLQYGRTYIFTIRPLYGEVEGPISTVYQRICKTLLHSFDI